MQIRVNVESRFSSLEMAPAATRQTLRARLRRLVWTHSTEPLRAFKPGTITLTDELALALFSRVYVILASEVSNAKDTYEQSASQAEPRWSELIQSGLVYERWGRVFMPQSVAMWATRNSTSRPGLARLAGERFSRIYRIKPRLPKSLSSVKDAILGRTASLSDIGCQSPRWVMSRLWDRNRVSDAPLTRLRTWVDRWEELGAPKVVPRLDFEATTHDLFIESAVSVLSQEPDNGWERRMKRVTALRSLNGRAETHLPTVPQMPKALVDRLQWLENPIVAWSSDFGDDRSIGALIFLLLSDVSSDDNSAAPHPLAKRVLDVAISRPDVLDAVIAQTRSHPVLLADLLLHAATASLACYIIGRQQLMSAVWDRDLIEGAVLQDHVTASEDAIAILAHHVEKNRIAALDLAALLRWLYDSRRGARRNAVTAAMLNGIRQIVRRGGTQLARDVIADLAGSVFEFCLGSPGFVAAFQIVADVGIESVRDPRALTDAYIRLICSGGYGLTADELSREAAAAVVEVATACDMRDDLLQAVAGLQMQGDDRDCTSRSTRAHVRLLCRAIAARPESVEKDLVDALVASLTLATRRSDAGSALFVRHEIRPSPVAAPIADDLAAAMNSLADRNRAKVLGAVLTTEEPLVLAQLVPLLSGDDRARVVERLRCLPPEAAEPIYFLPELQARIDALLATNLPDIAAPYLDQELAAKTSGVVPGRDLTRFVSRLRLEVLLEDWSAIAAKTVPESLTPSETLSAAEFLSFFKGVAALIDPDGDKQYAAALFAQLHARHPDVPSYANNNLAAQIACLLRQDTFQILHGEDAVSAQQLLDETAQAMQKLRLTDSDRASFDGNRAILLLALGRPEDAWALVASRAMLPEHPEMTATAAVALFRLGRSDEAVAILQDAEEFFESSPFLKAASDQIKGRRSSSVSTALIDSPAGHSRIRDALFTLTQMDAPQQARVLSAGGSLQEVVTRFVRLAATGIVESAAQIKQIDPEHGENTLNFFLRQFLLGYLDIPRWQAADESRGGFTAKGNAGERDIVIAQGAATLAVIEGVLCSKPISWQVTKDDLLYHFKKALGYSNCQLFFHVTYSRIENWNDILPFLVKWAEEEAPSKHFRYIDREQLEQTGSQPGGFVARYAAPQGEVFVVFLILDLEQRAQRDAAILADAIKSKRKTVGTKVQNRRSKAAGAKSTSAEP